MQRKNTQRFWVAKLVGLAMGMSMAGAVLADTEIKLLAADGLADDALGMATALDDGIVAVGAPNDDDNGNGSGSVYLFDAATGAQLDKLTALDGQAGDAFGFSVALGGGIVAIGAKGDDDNGANAGAVYLFNASTGAQLVKLKADDGQAGDEFGYAVSLADGLVAIGAWRSDDNGSDSGSAYLFDVSTFEQLEKLLPDDGDPIDLFGESICIHGGLVAVGAHGDDEANLDAGAAYVFDASDGSQLHKLTADDGARNDFLGAAISMSDGVVAVGAWAKSIVFDHSGAAYLFDASTGQQIGSRLAPSDGHDRAHFGISIAIDGGIVAIGADQNRENGFNAGAVYLYDGASGEPIDKILASDGEVFDLFGTSVAINNGVVAVGAIGDDDNGDRAGAAYSIRIGGCAADLDGDGDADAEDFFTYLDAFATGGLDVCDIDDDGDCDAIDFFEYLDLFAVGC